MMKKWKKIRPENLQFRVYGGSLQNTLRGVEYIQAGLLDNEEIWYEERNNKMRVMFNGAQLGVELDYPLTPDDVSYLAYMMRSWIKIKAD